MGDQTPRQKLFQNPLENGPEDRLLLLRNLSFSPESTDVRVGVSTVDLPCINNLIPLRQEKSSSKLVIGSFGRRLLSEFGDILLRRQTRFAKPGFIKAGADRVDRVHIDSLAELRLVRD